MKFPLFSSVPPHYPREEKETTYRINLSVIKKISFIWAPSADLTGGGWEDCSKTVKIWALGPQRQPHPADKWIGNKLPNSRDGPLILIKGDVKRRSAPHDNVNSPVGVKRRTTQPGPSHRQRPSPLFPLTPLVELG